MSDTVPGDASSIVTIPVGSTINGALETPGDRDWYRVQLVAGQTYSFYTSATGGSDIDTYLYLRDGAGNLITSDDDGGPGFFSLITFTASSTGTYFIDVGEFGDNAPGNFRLTVEQPEVLPVWTNDQIADQLTDGFWTWFGGQRNAFAVAPAGSGRSLTVNLTGLTAEGRFLARESLLLWTDVTGIVFNEVTSGGQITFDDNQPGAFAGATYNANGVSSSAIVNVGLDWLSAYGTGLNTYSFQTYIHEVGHALGLGHAGNYNGSAAYPDDAMYANDSWNTTVMSYFSPTENTYFGSQGFTYQWILTPMVADQAAMIDLYGDGAATRTGNTVYGFGNTSGRAVYDASANPNVGYTIYDDGGTDLLDYSGFSANQLVDLRAERFSNIGGLVGNVSIARGALIENAAGGSGNDTLIGNDAANRLAGNGGNDLIDGGAGDDIASYAAATAAIKVSLALAGAQNTLGAGTDTFVSIEGLIGSAFNDMLTGSTGINRLEGGGGNDKIDGGGDADTLFGDAGNDQLNGGAGVDQMHGGIGNDIYVVDNAGDLVFELAGQGVDTVKASGTYTLAGGVEKLALTGAANINGSGNELDNTVTGNKGANSLYGAGGKDVLNGGAGDDKLFSGPGADKMTGGTGADQFIMNSLTVSADRDLIPDFATGSDKVVIDPAVFTAFAGYTSGNAINAADFRAGPSATTPDHHLIYNQSSGELFYDPDGVGAASQVLIAILQNNPMLTPVDFIIR